MLWKVNSSYNTKHKSHLLGAFFHTSVPQDDMTRAIQSIDGLEDMIRDGDIAAANNSDYRGKNM